MRSTAARFALPAAVAVLALLAATAFVPGPAGAPGTTNATTTFAFDIRADGDARVTVTVGLPLEDESDRAGFERLADEHRRGNGDALSSDLFVAAAERSSAATGRPMAIRDLQRTAGRDGGTGRLSLAFTWTNFTQVAGERLFVGDAFRTPDGTWLPGLAANQELVIAVPRGYSPQSISVPGTRYQFVNGTVRVEGPASFEPGTPSLVLQQSAAPTAAEAPWRQLAIGAVVIAALLVGAFLARGRLPTGGATDDGGDEAADPVDGVPATDPMEEPLLSDEERVLALLAERNGRMKQVEIVEATDWSNAKVSQLLSEMEEADRVDKLRIGRENLISLPGEGPGGE